MKSAFWALRIADRVVRRTTKPSLFSSEIGNQCNGERRLHVNVNRMDNQNGKVPDTADRQEATTVQIIDPIPLSKNQLKKQQRRDKRKQKQVEQKSAKRAKAIAAGRDLDAEKRFTEERTKSGEGRMHREAAWLERSKTADAQFQICIDCSYEDQMTSKEILSLAQQIRYCYAKNKRSKNPSYFSVSNMSAKGETRTVLGNQNGFPDQWVNRKFEVSDKSLLHMHPVKGKLVYLTSDSENTLEHLEDDKIYVIGGIVDRNRLVRVAADRAEQLDVETAKLPIAQYLDMFTTKVLTCNHVFEILLKYREHGNDWKRAMLDVLPERKGALDKDNNTAA